MQRGGSLLALVLFATGTARGDSADPVVVRVGAREVRASEVERRLLSMPDFQRTALGSPEEVRRRIVEYVLVRDLLFSEEAVRVKLDGRPAVRERVDDALRRVLVREIERDVVAAGVPEADLVSYFEAHAKEYVRPERIRISRVLVEDEALAKKILGEARAKGGPSSWNQLVRDHSVDTSTRLRGGQLGFVGPDGHTDVPQLEVSPALYAAAAAVKDGEIAPEPVKEGARFAIVWRTGTQAAVNRTLALERESIRSIILQQRVEERLRELVARLTAAHVRDVEDSSLEDFAMPTPPAFGAPPGASARQALAAPSADPTPRSTERGLR